MKTHFLIFILILYSLFNFVACNKIYKLPNKLEFIKPNLLMKVHGDSNSHLGITVITIVNNINKFGIYTFTRSGPHRIYSDTFMYDGINVRFSKIDDIDEMIYFLQKTNFSKFSIKKFKRKLNRIKNWNSDVYKNLSF